MESKKNQTEIIVKGIVQGVGFRYFILRKANDLQLTGYVQNLYNGDVLIIAEGEKFSIDELVNYAKTGPVSATVESYSVKVSEYKNEFRNFELRY